MNFIVFNLLLLAASFPALLIFSVGLMVLLSPLAAFSKSERSPKTVVLPLTAMAALFQIYMWGLWSAFCVALTYKYTVRPEVTWDWIYFVCGFMWCLALIGWLSHKERSLESHARTLNRVRAGTLFYTIAAIVGFVVFAIWPHLMVLPFGWAINPLGLTEYVAADPFLVNCPQPLPEFTLGPTSSPTEAEVARLCDCIWGGLNSQERDISRAIVGGNADFSEADLRAFISGLGRVVEQCGGTNL